MAEKYSEKMPTRGIRMSDEQWKMCQEMSDELGYRYPSDFIRDAIDFYVEWKKSDSAEKFLTPALESVVRGIVKDSEDRNVSSFGNESIKESEDTLAIFASEKNTIY